MLDNNSLSQTYFSFYNQLITYIKYLCKKFEIDLNDIAYEKIISHVKQSDKTILFVIYVFLIVLDFISIIFNFRKFSKINYKKKIFLLKLFIPFNFAIQKINEFLLIIVTLHKYGEEIIEPIILDKKNFQTDQNLEFAVVGSGPSGSIIANELNKVFRSEVTIIEKGKFLNIPKDKHPGAEFANKWFRGGLNSTLFNDMIAYSSGSCFGGGSEINSGLYHEPDEVFFKNWESEFKTLSFSLNENIKYIKKVRELVNLQLNNNSKFNNQLITNSKIKDQISQLKRFISTSNQKNSMSNTLLKEFINNDGKILLETKVNKIKYINNKWELEIISKNKRSSIRVINLFLCCGSIFTNDLILKSKILKNKRNILNKFKFHPMIKAAGVYDQKIQEMNEDIIPIQNMKYYPNYIFGNASSSLQFIISSFITNNLTKRNIIKEWEKIKIFHSTFSLGIGKIIRIPFFEYPLLTYKINKLEKDLMIQGYSSLLKFIRETGAKKILPIGDNKKNNFFNADEIESYNKNLSNINSLQISSVHILGGVTMGEREDCIVNSFGEVNECKNLFITDSSLINTKLLKNPQGTIMMLAYRNIDYFIKNYKKKI